MGRYRKVKGFSALPLRERQRWVNEFVTQAERRMSAFPFLPLLLFKRYFPAPLEPLVSR